MTRSATFLAAALALALSGCGGGMSRDHRSGSAEVLVNGVPWVAGWSGHPGSVDQADVAAGPAVAIGAPKLLMGDLGVVMANETPTAEPALTGTEGAEAAIQAAMELRPLCGPVSDWIHWGAPANGTLYLTEPRYDPVQEIWIFKGRCDYDDAEES